MGVTSPRVGPPSPTRGGTPPSPRTPLPHAWETPSLTWASFFRLPHTPPRHGAFFWTPHYTPPSPPATWYFFPKCTPNLATKGAFWRSNLVPWQATAPGRSVYCAHAWPRRALHPAERSHLALFWFYLTHRLVHHCIAAIPTNNSIKTPTNNGYNIHH